MPPSTQPPMERTITLTDDEIWALRLLLGPFMGGEREEEEAERSVYRKLVEAQDAS